MTAFCVSSPLAAFRTSSVGAGIFDRFGSLLDANPALSARLGEAGMAALAREVRESRRGVTERTFDLHVANEGGAVDRFEIALSAVENGGAKCFLVVALDSTARRPAAHVDIRRNEGDWLTALPDRPMFLAYVREALATGDSGAVLFLNLDAFKPVNDTYGHAAGDGVLVQAAGRLSSLAGIAHVVSRVGGDEFGVLLRDVDLEEARRFAERVQEVLGKPFVVGDRETTISASIGIATFGSVPRHGDDVLREADAAMHWSKSLGRARLAVFDDEIRTKMLRAARLRADIRIGIERGDFRVVYQPLVNIATGQPLGMEALVRWTHPTLGPVGPDEFIPYAERSGAIVELGRFVLREATAFAARIDALAPGSDLTLSVNISPNQVTYEGIYDDVASALRDAGFHANRLMLEMTESSLIETQGKTLALFNRFKKLGAQMCIDDFGTGYSSLRYLQDFPIDLVKLDRGFISSVNDENMGLANEAIVEMTMSLARALNMSVVAEGIETERQVAILKIFGVVVGQGFFFAKPLEAEAFLAWLGIEKPAVAVRRPRRMKQTA